MLELVALVYSACLPLSIMVSLHPTCVPGTTPPFPLTGLAKPPFVAWGGANVNQDLYPKVLTVGCSLRVGDVNFYRQPKIAVGKDGISRFSLRLMVLTSYFTTKKDWQRGKYAKPSFSKIQTLGFDNAGVVSRLDDCTPDT